MSHDDVEILAEETAYDGYFRIDRYRLRHRRHDGQWSGEMMREVFERGHAVAVLPYDPVADRFVLIEQFRIGAFARGDQSPWLLEMVAGIVEEGEAPDDVARRETREETGLGISALVPIAEFYVSPGGTTQYNWLYCARVDATDAGGVHGLDHEHEDIRVVPLSAEEIPALLTPGRVRDVTTLLALHWLAANRARLRTEWCGRNA